MNGGNLQRGQADGFNIDILPKLKDVKSRDNSTNLLQYVVRFSITKFDPKKGTPEAKMPIPEPSDVEKCEHLNFEDQEAECSRLEKELDKIKIAKDKVVKLSEPNYLEPFQEKMNKFIDEANDNIKELNNLIKECSSKFILTMKFFRFKPKDGRVETAQVNIFQITNIKKNKLSSFTFCKFSKKTTPKFNFSSQYFSNEMDKYLTKIIQLIFYKYGNNIDT